MENPVYADNFRRSTLHIFTPVIAGVLTVFGLLQLELFNVALGIGLGLFILFTRHVRYEIFNERLVIRYMGPRRKIVDLSEIQSVQSVRMAFGGQGIFIQKKTGLGLVINPVDPDRFVVELEKIQSKS